MQTCLLGAEIVPIIHRHLKSSNTLIVQEVGNGDPSRQILKITDFGLAGEWMAANSPVSAAGTSAWTAPGHSCFLLSKGGDVGSGGALLWSCRRGTCPSEESMA